MVAWFQVKVWPARWVLIGGVALILGIITNDTRSMLFGIWVLLDQRIKQAEMSLELNELQIEARLTSLIYWGERKENNA